MNRSKSLEDLTADVIDSYRMQGGDKTENLGYLPDKGEIVKIIEILRGLLFPGYFNKGNTVNSQLACDVHCLLAEAENRLRRQICSALRLDSDSETAQTDAFDRAGRLCRVFLGKLPALRETLLSDVQAAYDGDPAARNKHEIIFAYPGIFAISVYRLAHELHILSVPLIPRMMTEYAHSLTGIDIHPGAVIGRCFFIDHGTGVVIGETTVIGERVKLYQGVTLGGISTRGGQSLRGVKRHPTLEDEVTVYSGASILGGDTVIGMGSVIGGNVFLTRSVPPNTRVNMKAPELDFRSM